MPYALARKGVKWYCKLAEVFIDFAIDNAYLIWKKLNVSKRTNLEFRIALVEAIIIFHVNGQCKAPLGPTSIPDENKDPLRLKEKHFISRIPAYGEKRMLRKCVQCFAMKKRRDTSLQCARCNVSLCLEPCFEIYHTKKYYYADTPPESSSTEETDSSTEEEVIDADIESE